MKAVVSLLCVLISGLVHAQKENNVWVNGDFVGLDFGSGAPVVFERPPGQNIWRTNAAVCDANGNLLFYTNGFRIFNRDFQIMENGDSLAIGDYIFWGYNELSVQNGAAIIPIPEQSGKYYVVHTDLNLTDFDTIPGVLMSTHLYYTIVDMTLNGGLGDVVAGQRNLSFLSDTLTQAGFKVIKHGNGRDYWIVCHEAGSNRFYRFLVDPLGFHGPYEQFIGGSLNGLEGAHHTAILAVSKEGTKAAQLRSFHELVDLYDFNRCTGEFENLQTLAINDSLLLWGAEFSSSGRFLYVSAHSRSHIYQFDLQATDVEASQQLVAVYAGTMNPFQINFDKLGLAPDGKIYVAGYGGNNSVSIIHQPDSLGLACQFEENGLQIYPPGINWSGVPNTVNYSLGALVGSGCDTLTSVEALSKPSVVYNVYPNPFADKFQLRINGVSQNVALEIVNVLNQRVYQAVLSPHSGSVKSEIDLSSLPGGVYVLKFSVNGERYAVRVVKGD